MKDIAKMAWGKSKHEFMLVFYSFWGHPFKTFTLDYHVNAFIRTAKQKLPQ
jgi:hypothetical protein